MYIKIYSFFYSLIYIYNMPEGKNDNYVDLNYEEVSCNRVITDGNFGNGLQQFTFNISPSGGGCVIPHMSYFLVEFNFGDADGSTDAYTAKTALPQSKKIVLQNNFMSTMYTASRFTVAQTAVSEVNNAHAQAHTLMRRLGYDTTFIEDLGADMNGFDPDFSRRLARYSKDGVLHRDGLINCEPYESDPLGSLNYGNVPLTFQSGVPLTRDPTNTYFNGTNLASFTATATAQFGFMSKYSELNVIDGEGGIPSATTDANLATTTVNCIQYIGPVASGLPTATPAENDAAIDGDLLNVGDEVIINFEEAVPTAAQSLLSSKRFRLVEKKVQTSSMVFSFKVLGGIDAKTVKDVYNGGTAAPIPNTGFRLVTRSGGNQYNQADPRSNTVNNVVAYQPPISFFRTKTHSALFGNMEISLNPNQNWRQAAVESSRSVINDGYYGTDIKHGVNYCFGIKSMRLYLARAKMLESPPASLTYHVEDVRVMNRQLAGGSNNIEFSLPTSTQRIAIWIQDSAVGTHTMLPLTRFKPRQYTRDDTGASTLAELNKYGPWANDYSERIRSLQVNFAGITKPITNFQRASGNGTIGDGTTNSMLQRWIMSNQNNHNKRRPEKYTDWLSMGPYYLFDFTRSADNLGTRLSIDINYAGTAPTQGNSATDTASSNINIYVGAFYMRDVALNYGPMGNVLSVATQEA